MSVCNAKVLTKVKPARKASMILQILAIRTVSLKDDGHCAIPCSMCVSLYGIMMMS